MILTKNQVFDEWLTADELLKETGLTMKQAEEAEKVGFFQRSTTTKDKPFKDGRFTAFSVELYHQGREVYPMLGERYIREQQQANEKRQREEEAKEKALENNRRIVKAYQLEKELKTLKQ